MSGKDIDGCGRGKYVRGLDKLLINIKISAAWPVAGYDVYHSAS